jgi:hypothetical protein
VNQSVISGPFAWSQKAAARLLECQHGADWMVRTAHDGYLSRFGVEHDRTISACANEIEIIDRIVPANSGLLAELVYQFAPGLSLVKQGADWLIYKEREMLAALWIEQIGVTALSLGENRVDGGWVSPAFSIKVPAPRLSWFGQVPASGVRTVLRITRALAD